MPHDRFFSAGELQESVILEGQEFHHLAHVLRIRVGEQVELVNGQGELATGVLEGLGKDRAALRVTSKQSMPMSRPKLCLGLPFLKMNRLELAIEKGTELGADAFYFYPAERSEKNDLSPNQLERLHHLCISALKQSGRLYLPHIELFSSLDALLSSEARIYFGDTDPTTRPLAKDASANTILFISGPESGFSDKEIALLKQRATGVSLHKNILRAETAPLAALAILTFLYEKNDTQLSLL